MQIEFYVAFSISGSNCFIRARKHEDMAVRPQNSTDLKIDGLNFKVSKPRYGISQNNGVKLLAEDLNAAYDTGNAKAAFDFFQKLKGLGWKVLDDKKFAEKHGINIAKSHPVEPPVQPVVEHTIPASEFVINESDPNTALQIAAETAKDSAVLTQPVAPILSSNVKIGARQQSILNFLEKGPASLDIIYEAEKAAQKAAGKKPYSRIDVKEALQGLIKRNMVKMVGDVYSKV